MIIELALGASAVWATVDHAMPWMVKQQIKLEQPRQLTEEEREALELRVEDQLLNRNYRELPRVIVIPISEPETPRQRLTIRSNDAE